MEFNAAGVEYLLVGAHAMSAHGIPRATGDIDLWVRCTPENAKRIMSALRTFGAPLSDVSENDFEQPGIVYFIGVAPCRIDVLTEISGVDFDEAWPHRLVTRIDDIPVTVIGREDLYRNKVAANRLKDRADARWIAKSFGIK